MQAVMKTKKGYGNVSYSTISEPKCTEDGVKVKIAYSGICGTDLHVLHDTFKNYPPVVLGHEFSGIVSEVGSNVKKVKVGDRVAILGSTAITCKECIYCKTGHYMFCNNRRGMGHGVDGSFTDYVVVREDMIYQLPEHISMEEAALAEPLACAVQAVEELTDIKVGDTVLLSGPGPIGLLCLSLLVHKGCKVIVSGTSQDNIRLKLAKDIGADKIIDIEAENLSDVIINETDGIGADVTIDCSGATKAIDNCFSSLKKMGKHIQVGIIGDRATLNYDLLLYKQIKLFGSLAHSMTTWEKVMNIFKQRKINLKKLITHKFELQNWQQAFEVCTNKSGGKVLIYYDENKGNQVK